VGTNRTVQMQEDSDWFRSRFFNLFCFVCLLVLA